MEKPIKTISGNNASILDTGKIVSYTPFPLFPNKPRRRQI